MAVDGPARAAPRPPQVVTVFGPPVVAWQEADDAGAPLVVLLHGRGSDERDILTLAEHLPHGIGYAAVRGPIVEGNGYAWFANRGIGRPVAESLAETMAWFREWLDTAAPDREVIVVGFSGGAAFAGGLILADPGRYAAAAILSGTLPFDAGVPVVASRLAGMPVLVAHGAADGVIPGELLDRTWEYLHTEAGARTIGLRGPGGHAITAEVAEALARWLTDTLARQDR